MQASRTDARFSTYSGAPSLQPSLQPSLAPTFDTQTMSTRSSQQARAGQQSYLTAQNMSEKNRTPYGDKNVSASTSTTTLSSTDPKTQDLKTWSGTLERMQDERLEKQRYIMTDVKTAEVSKLALGAKVERALSRRMTGQDAVFTKRKKAIDIEKRSLEVEAN